MKEMSPVHSRPLRVFYFTAAPPCTAVYGSERSLLDLIDGMHRHRFVPCGAVAQAEGCMARALRDRGIPVAATGIRPILKTRPGTCVSFLPALWRCVAAVRRAQADLIHANHIILNQYAALTGAILRIPAICHLRGRPDRLAYWAHLACLSSAIIANSRFTAGGWQTIRAASARTRVIYNGIDVERFMPAAGAQRSGQITSPRAVTLGIVGRISREKGHDVAVRALGLLQPNLRPRLSVFGDATGPVSRARKEALMALVADLGLKAAVAFAGFVADAREIYARMDVLVLPSRSESFGRVLIEAMAMGLPVIATYVGGVPEIVVHGETGLLVPPDDPKSLSEAILLLVTRPELRTALGLAGRRRALQLFSLDRYVASIEALYGDLCAPRTERALRGAGCQGRIVRRREG